MPWHVEYGNAGCGDERWAVVKDADGSIVGCHDEQADAQQQVQALYANEIGAGVDQPLTAAADVSTGAMVAFVPSAADAQAWAIEGGEPADQLHVTSIYLGEAASIPDDVQLTIIALCKTLGETMAPIETMPFGLGVLNPAGPEPCLVAIVGGQSLADAQAAVVKAIGEYASAEQHVPWLAHMTLLYDGDPSLYFIDAVGPLQQGAPMILDTLRVAFGGVVTDIPLVSRETTPDGESAVPNAQTAAADPPAAPVIPMTDAIPTTEGTPFSGVAAVEGVWTGDDRQFAPNSLTWAPLPIALKWQIADDDEHKGSVVVGRIDSITREGNQIRVAGVMDNGPDGGLYGNEAARMMRRRMLRGVSITADDADETDIEYVMPGAEPAAEVVEPDDIEVPVVIEDGEGEDFHLPGKHNQKDHGHSTGPKIDRSPIKAPTGGSPRGSLPRSAAVDGAEDFHYDDFDALIEQGTGEIYHAGRLRSLTLVSEPAFVEAEIFLDGMDETTAAADPDIALKPVTVASLRKSWRPTTVTASGYTITIPELWPEEWFNEPDVSELPPFGAVTITASGRVIGLIAPKYVVHRSFRTTPQRVTVPTGQDYREFNNKPALVASADGVAQVYVGSLTFDCGHADPFDPRRADPVWAREHYENSCSIAARVRAGEHSRTGQPFVAGALMHGMDAEKLERMMGCAVSGDWQGGKFNAALLVPVEGFPTTVAASARVRIKDEGAMVASFVPLNFEGRSADTHFAAIRAKHAARQLAEIKSRRGK